MQFSRHPPTEKLGHNPSHIYMYNNSTEISEVVGGFLTISRSLPTYIGIELGYKNNFKQTFLWHIHRGSIVPHMKWRFLDQRMCEQSELYSLVNMNITGLLQYNYNTSIQIIT